MSYLQMAVQCSAVQYSTVQWKCEQPLFAEKYKMIYPLQMLVFTNTQKELESYLG